MEETRISRQKERLPEIEPRVSVVEGHDSRGMEFVIVEGWSRTLADYRFERENFDDARTYFWSQVFCDQETLWRLIDYAKNTD